MKRKLLGIVARSPPVVGHDLSRHILAGGEPKELVVKLRRESSEPRYHSFSADALSRASTEELLLELRRRIIRPRDRRRETWDDWDGPDSRDDWGRLDSRGDWPEEGYLQE